MCAIVDANARDEVFGQRPTEPGRLLLDWLSRKSGRLVIGGRLKDELLTSDRFKTWLARNDRALQRDFKTSLGEGIRGVIYTTARSAHVTRGQRRTLQRKDICGRVA